MVPLSAILLKMEWFLQTVYKGWAAVLMGEKEGQKFTYANMHKLYKHGWSIFVNRELKQLDINREGVSRHAVKKNPL